MHLLSYPADRSTRRSARPVVVPSLLLLWAALAGTRTADAVCSAIPVPVRGDVSSALGAVDRPFASPGDVVAIGPDDTVSTAVVDLSGLDAEQVVVSVVFKPALAASEPSPSASPMPNLVVLAPEARVLAPCSADVPTTFLPGAASDSAIGGDPARLLFRFPATHRHCAAGAAGGRACLRDDDCEGAACEEGLALCVGGGRDGLPCGGADCGGGHCRAVALTGPAAIAVTAAGAPLPCGLATRSCEDMGKEPAHGLLACIDRLVTREGRPHPTFPHFTALPVPNDYAALSVAPLRDRDLEIALDADGNLLVPIDWTSVLLEDRSGRGALVARLIRFATSVDAFPGPPRHPIKIPDGAGGGPTFLASFTPGGVPLPPIFDPQVNRTDERELILFGSADERRSVLRIARHARACVGGPKAGDRCVVDDPDCPEGGACVDVGTCAHGDFPGRTCGEDRECCRLPPCSGACADGIFDFGTRMLGGVGPVVVSRPQFEAQALAPVPLDGMVQTEALNAFVVDEAAAQKDLDGDGFWTRDLVTVQDRASGDALAAARGPSCAQDGPDFAPHVVRVPVPPFSMNALAAEDDVVAFLEPEDQVVRAYDFNCDGDAIDAVLRVLHRTAHGKLEAARVRSAVDPAPFVSGRSLTVSEGLVFLRTPEIANAPPAALTTMLVSVGALGEPANGASRHAVIAGNGRFVAFASDADNLTDDDDGPASDVFVRDLCLVDGEPLTACTPHTTRVSAGVAGTNAYPAISEDGRFVAFVSHDAAGNHRLFVRDRDADAPTLVSGDLPVLDPKPPAFSPPAIWSAGDRFVVVFAVGTWGQHRLYAYDSTVPPAVALTPAATCASQPAIGGDGSVVAYTRRACGIPTLANPIPREVVARDCDAAPGDCTVAISAIAPDIIGATYSGLAVVSADSRYVAFHRSGSDGLSTALPQMTGGIEVHDLAARLTARLDRAGIFLINGLPTGISHDGRFVAETIGSTSRLFVSGFAVIDRASGMPIHVAQGFANALSADGSGWFPMRSSLSADGRLLAFEKHGEKSGDVFVRNVRSHPVDDAIAGDRAADLTGNGRVAETVLQVLDGRSGVVVGPSCPAGYVAVANGRAAFLRPERGGACGGSPAAVTSSPSGVDLNGDQDFDDDVVQLWDGGVVRNLALPATAVSMTIDPETRTGFIAALVPECAKPGDEPNGCPGGGIDDDGDEDTLDEIVNVCAVPPPGSDDFACTSLHQAATRVEVSGNVVAFLTPEAAAERILNNDQDLSDDVLQIHDLCTGRATTVGKAAEDFVVGGRNRFDCGGERSELVAFRSRESDQCDAGGVPDPLTCAPPGCTVACDADGKPAFFGCDLNCDGDCCDDILHVKKLPEIVGQSPVNYQTPVTPCTFASCDPAVPYRVGANTVTFLTLERDQGRCEPTRQVTAGGAVVGCDLNGDGDAGDLVLQVLNVRADPPTVSVLGAVPVGSCRASGRACLADPDCGAGDACRLLAGRCVYASATPCCVPSPEEPGCRATCNGLGAFCAQGLCHSIGGTCTRDEQCGSDGTCDRTALDLARLASPLAAPGGGGEVFTGVANAGRCRDAPEIACARRDDCPNASLCDPAPLTIATANDADGDEIPDAFDNCPEVANADQGDVCGDAPACGDGVVAGPREICDDGTPADTGDATDRCFGCTRLCGPAPRSDCRVAGAQGDGTADLRLRPGGVRGPTLDFRWRNATATAQDVDDPLARASYALCVYDGGAAAQPLLEIQARAGRSCTTGACWKRFGRHGFRYSDRSVKNGLTQLALGRKSNDRMRIRAVGKGPAAAPASLPLATPVTVQLVNSATGACWQARFEAPTANLPGAFRAVVKE